MTLIDLSETVMKTLSTPHELEQILGENIKALRLQKNIDRKSLCNQAGISENALRNLEGGKGATIKTLTYIVKALGRESWINSLAPQTSINPLHMTRTAKPRQRARRKNDDKKE
jgi:transcriptional regulator with XRE-family HTH domain